jgi:FlaG/FlaF family flagellin (archaellin)
MSRFPERGSALVTAVIVVLVVSVIAAGVINFASREVAGATAGAQRQALTSCAESARQLLISRFHSVGLVPTALDALNVTLDGTGGRTVAMGGHVDESASTVQVSQVQFLPDNSFGPTTRTRDLTNTISLIGQGGKPLRVIVHCVDRSDGTATGGRQLEVEFGVRFGL